jgi:hypothetical protein
MNQVMTIDPAFNQPLPAVFQGMDAGDDLSGGITGGYGLLRIRGKVFTIHYQQQEITLMRDDGDGPKGSVELVIVKANPHLSKTWYENGWDENNSNPPDCASANGVVPDAGVPKRQSPACANCPRNQWGTGANGGKGKACADHRRLAIVPLMDLNNEAFGGPMLLRCPAASLQDLAAFDAKYKAAGYPYFSLGVRVAFDPKESYPKLVFSAIRPLGEQEAALVVQLRNSDATARVIADAVPVVVPEAAPPAVTFEQPPQQPAQPPIQAQQAPVQQAAPAPAPAAHAPSPAAAPVQPTGFGAAAPARPAQAAQQPAQQAPVQPQRPSQTMTGFGAAAPQPAAQQAPQQVAQPVQPQQVTGQPPLPGSGPVDFASSLDERLAGLIGS